MTNAEGGVEILKQVLARMDWVVIDPTGAHEPADFLPGAELEVVLGAGMDLAAVAAVAFRAAHLLREEYGPLHTARATDGVPAGREALHEPPVLQRAVLLLNLACRGADQSEVRILTHQALEQLGHAQAPAMLAALLDLFVARARQLHGEQPGAAGRP